MWLFTALRGLWLRSDCFVAENLALVRLAHHPELVEGLAMTKLHTTFRVTRRGTLMKTVHNLQG